MHFEETNILLRLSKDQWELSFSAGRIGTWHWDVRHNRLIWSKEQEALYGLQEGEFGQTAEDFLQFIYPEDLEKLLVNPEYLSSEPSDNQYEFRIRRKDGAIRWIMARSRTVFNDKGQLEHVTGINIDITDQKEQQEKLEQSRQELIELANAMPQLVWIADPGGKVLYYNDRVAEFAGAKRLADGNWTWDGILHPDDLESTYAAWRKAVANGERYEKEHRMQMKDGSFRWHLSRALPHRNKDNQIVQWFGTATDIHEQKSLSESVKESEERYAATILASDLGLWDFDPRAQKFVVSGKLSDILGLPGNEHVTVETLFNCIHPDDHAVQEQLYRTIMDSSIDPHFTTEYRIIDQSTGKVKWVRAKGRVYFDNSGTVYRTIGTVAEITLEKESRTRYQGLFEAAPISIMEEDFTDVKETVNTLKRKGINNLKEYFRTRRGELHELIKSLRITDINKAALNLIEASSKAEAMRNWGSIFVDDTDEAFLEELQIMAEGGGAFKFETILQTLRGKRIEVLVHIDFPRGDDYRSILVTLLDISDRKAVERAIRESENRFRILAQSIPQIVWTTNAQGKADYFNQRWEEYTGQPLEEAVENWSTMVHPDDRERVMKSWKEALRAGDVWKEELRYYHAATLEYRWFMGISTPLKDEHGEIRRWIGSATDIQSLKLVSEVLELRVEQRTRELQQSNEKLQQTNAELAQFAYVASHDLQEPLRKIRTFSNLLSLRLDSPAECLTYIEKISGSALRMSRLINDLLEFSQITNHDRHFVPVNLNHVLDQIKSDFELMISEKNATIDVDRLPVIHAVPLQMNQLFHNLISNALKFSREVPPVINVRSKELTEKDMRSFSTLDQQLKYVEIQVHDNGIGFDPDYGEKIFTLFHQLNDKRKFNGTGIGLTICRKIVGNHRGLIHATSAEGVGSVFTVVLPVDPR